MITAVRVKYVRFFTGFGVRGAVVPVNNRTKAGKGPASKLTPRWLEWIRSKNSAASFQYLMSANTGWVNEGADRSTVQSITMGGNVGLKTGSAPKFTRLDSLHVFDEPPSDPVPLWLLLKFTCLDGWGRKLNPGQNFDVFFPFITAGDAWVENRFLDFFETMPDPDWPQSVPDWVVGVPAVIRAGAQVRTGPEGNKALSGDSRLRSDLAVRIIEEARGWSSYGPKRWVESRFVIWD